MMNKFLHTVGGLDYVEYNGNVDTYTFDLDELPARHYSIEDVYNLMEQWVSTINPGKAARIVVTTKGKGKQDSVNLFFTFTSILSKGLTRALKEGEKRLAPRTQIMEQTSVDMITMKRFLNYVCDVEYLQVELIRKGKSIAAL